MRAPYQKYVILGTRETTQRGKRPVTQLDDWRSVVRRKGELFDSWISLKHEHTNKHTDEHTDNPSEKHARVRTIWLSSRFRLLSFHELYLRQQPTFSHCPLFSVEQSEPNNRI